MSHIWDLEGEIEDGTLISDELFNKGKLNVDSLYKVAIAKNKIMDQEWFSKSEDEKMSINNKIKAYVDRKISGNK